MKTIARLGKRIVFGIEGDLFAVIHLMIAGRFQWRRPDAPVPRKRGHAAFDFARGTLLITEATTRKRASLHLARGEAALMAHDPGGTPHAASQTIQRGPTRSGVFFPGVVR